MATDALSLNERQETFVALLATGKFSQAEAARRAGYSQDLGSSKVQGSRLLANTNVAKALSVSKQTHSDNARGVLGQAETAVRRLTLAVDKLELGEYDAAQLMLLQSKSVETLERLLSIEERYGWGKATPDIADESRRAAKRYRAGRLAGLRLARVGTPYPVGRRRGGAKKPLAPQQVVVDVESVRVDTEKG